METRLAGAVNFRDLGGYATRDGRTVRAGQVYRSDSLHQLTEEDLHLLTTAVPLRTIFDLRMSEELEQLGVGAFAGDVVPELVHAPIFETIPEHWKNVETAWGAPDRIAATYAEMLEMGADGFATVLRRLAADDTVPAVIHCVAGRDRTGVTCALLLELLGVPDEVIAADYALTGERIPEPVVFPDTMTHLLALVRDRHGSVEGWARDVGLSDAEVGSLRDGLLE